VAGVASQIQPYIALVKIYDAEFTIGKRRNFHAVIPPKTLTTLPNPVLVIMLEAISRDSVIGLFYGIVAI